MAYQHNQTFIALGSTSTATSPAWFGGDFRMITVSFESKASLGASRLTIEVSNADGLQTTDLNQGTSSSSAGWSTLTGINMIGRTPGTVALDPGARWYRALVPVLTQSAASYTTAIFYGSSI